MSDRNMLIAESGATKTDWAYLPAAGQPVRFRTGGINLALMGAEGVMAVALAAAEHLPVPPEEVKDIRFYGAGLVSADSMRLLNKVLTGIFTSASVAYGSDLLAAAKAAFGDGQGMVGILGTGSNSAFYDGRSVKSTVFSGGYVLGDEGSGNALGKALLADYIKGLLPERLEADFDAEYGLTYPDIVEKLYKGGNPAGFLASFAPFVLAHRGDEYADALIDRVLRSFVERHLLHYDYRHHKLALVGSIACECREELTAIAEEYGMNISKFIRQPLDEMLKNYV